MVRAQEAILDSPGDNYLLVEGLDDWHILSHLRGNLTNFDIGYCGNDDKVLEKLSAVVVGSGTTKSIIGAVLDPDTGVEARLQSIKTRLQSAYDLPNTFPVEGMILQPRASHLNRERLPVIGVWLMPDNVRDGILEDLLCSGIASAANDYVANVVQKAKADGIAGYRDVERSKVIVRTYIAWQDPNKKNVGEALGPYFQNLGPACKDFLGWMERLFGAVEQTRP